MKTGQAMFRRMMVLPIALLVLGLAAACGSDDGPSASSGETDISQFIVETEKTFSVDDLKTLGWKEQKDFVLEYPQAEVARWGFLDAKELGVLIYPSAEIAKVAGVQAAQEQTATDEDGQAVGEIDRISCRDAQGQSAVGLRESIQDRDSSEVIHVTFKSEVSEEEFQPRVCSNKYPTYSEFRVIGNMVVLCEGEGRTLTEPSTNCRKLPEWLQVN